MQAGFQQFGLRFGVRRRTSIVLAACAALAVACGLSAPTEAQAQSRHAAMAIDANTGQILHAQAADEPRYPASLTKMMTVYIVFELLEQGRLQPTTRIRISPNAAATSPSKLGLEAGSEITVANAVQALIVKSANDMAVAVAEHIAGSEAKFAALMTQKARQLGMTRTTFRNAHGLPDSGQVTTARDMLTLAMRLHDDFPQQYRQFALRTFTYAGVQHRNHNTMLASYRGMDGLKTGYTSPSGFNLVASVHRDGRHVVAAVFGGSSAATRNAHMRVILDRALPRASMEQTRRPAVIARAPRPDPALPRPEPKLIEPVAPIVVAKPTEAPRLVQVPREVVRPAAPGLPFALVPGEEVPPAPVEVARVRPVVVAPRPRPAGPTVAANEPPATAAPTGPSPVAVRPPPQPVAPAQPGHRGAPPSSLQAQADRLKRGEPAAVPPPTVTAPQRQQQPTLATVPVPKGPGPAPPRGEIMIQVGAYASEAEAQRQLQIARAKSGDVLGPARAVTQAVTSGGRSLYRARFAGFDAASAAKACNELRRHQIDCHVGY